MQLTGLVDLFRDHPRYQTWRTDQNSLSVVRAARPFLLATIAQEERVPILYLTARIKRAYNVSEQLPVWLTDRPIYRFAEPAPHFYERGFWGESVIRNRIQSLAALLNDQPSIVVTSVRAWMQRTMPVHQFRQSTLRLAVGQQQILDKLLATWLGMGYEANSLVVEPGTFSRRGGVLDIFPIAADSPVRIDFFGDEIESLRLFDPATQRTTERIQTVEITPAREVLPSQTAFAPLTAWFEGLPPESELHRDQEALQNGATFQFIEQYLPYIYPQPIHVLDYASNEALIVVEDLDEIRETIAEVDQAAQKKRADEITAGRLPPDYPLPYSTWETLEATLQNRRILSLHASDNDQPRLFFPGVRFGGQLKPAMTQLRALTRKGGNAITVIEQPARILDLWREQDHSGFVPILSDLTQKPAPGLFTLITGTLQEGWTLQLDQQEIRLITEAELFGWSRPEPRRRSTLKRVKVRDAEYGDWREGDYVVHIDYGIGRFMGLGQRIIEGNERQYLVVEYANNDTLYVPIHQADRLTRYIGANDSPPNVNRLGQPDWVKTRNKAQKAVEEEAEEMLQLYAARAQVARDPFAPDNHWQRELEASFPYVETEDQLRAVRDVKTDLERNFPMDRLICGDVGYGKTEVAIRAAFKAVMDGKQVALLVPTTILANQHYETFRARMSSFPVEVEQLSRFRGKEDQEKILPRLKNGEIDIIIGTHRILSEDIQFQDLDSRSSMKNSALVSNKRNTSKNSAHKLMC